MFISLVRYTIIKSIVACSDEIKKADKVGKKLNKTVNDRKQAITSTNLQNLTNHVKFCKSDVYNQQAPVTTLSQTCDTMPHPLLQFLDPLYELLKRQRIAIYEVSLHVSIVRSP